MQEEHAQQVRPHAWAWAWAWARVVDAPPLPSRPAATIVLAVSRPGRRCRRWTGPHRNLHFARGTRASVHGVAHRHASASAGTAGKHKRRASRAPAARRLRRCPRAHRGWRVASLQMGRTLATWQLAHPGRGAQPPRRQGRDRSGAGGDCWAAAEGGARANGVTERRWATDAVAWTRAAPRSSSSLRAQAARQLCVS